MSDNNECLLLHLPTKNSNIKTSLELTYMSRMLKISRLADHRSVYSPARALRLRSRLIAARKPLQPNFTAGACHFKNI